MATTPALEVIDVSKRFGETLALRGMSFQVPANSRTALLGPNGAGKTTLLRLLVDQLRLDGGSVRLMGSPLNKDGLAQVGLVPQELAIYMDLTARENLLCFGRFQGLRGSELQNRVNWGLDWIGLTDRQHELVKKFSGGMKRRVNIACGCLHRPKLLLLDEPTVGVDPQSRQRIFEMLRELQANGTTLLWTTHHLDEAESECDYVIIVDHGKTIASGTFEQIIADSIGSQTQVSMVIQGTLSKPPDPLVWNARIQRWSCSIGDPVKELPELLQCVESSGGSIADFQLKSTSLNDVFLSLTGRDLRE